MPDWFSIRFTDFLIILSTIIGPIAAVQVQKFLERATERKNRKLQIFRTLMATRATRLSIDHVNAVNAIELEFGPSKSFFSWQTAGDKQVLEAYKFYLDRLCDQVDQNQEQIRAWNMKCSDLFVDLLYQMSQSMGYNFDKANIRKSVYRPKGHIEIENSQNIIAGYIINIAEGRASLPVRNVGDASDANGEKK